MNYYSRIFSISGTTVHMQHTVFMMIEYSQNEYLFDVVGFSTIHMHNIRNIMILLDSCFIRECLVLKGAETGL